MLAGRQLVLFTEYVSNTSHEEVDMASTPNSSSPAIALIRYVVILAISAVIVIAGLRELSDYYADSQVSESS